MYVTINGICYIQGNSLIFKPGKGETAFEIDDPESVDFLLRLLPLCTGTTSIEKMLEYLAIERNVFLNAIQGLIELNVMSIIEKPQEKVRIVTQHIPHQDLRNLTESPMLQGFCEIADVSQIDSSVTFVVAVDYEGNTSLFEAVQRQATTLRVPWMKVSLQDLTLRLGPVFFPDGGPCYYCYAERVSLNKESSNQLMQIGHFGRTESLIAPFLEREILKYIRHIGPSPLFEREVLINTFNLEMSSYRVLKMPGCEACAR